jgi:hypothetical protein
MADAGAADIRVAPARIGLAGTYRSEGSELPFALGAHGPLRHDGGRTLLDPAQLLLHGRGAPAGDPVPDASLRGRLALGDALALDLDGSIARWPAAWPELPAPLHRPAGPIATALDYLGPVDLSGIVALQARKDATRFDGRFRIRDIQAWLDAGMASPLPPLDGSLRTPVLEIAGARLQGVSISVEDPAVEAAADDADD